MPILTGGHVFGPDGRITPADVTIEGDTIVAVGPGDTDPHAEQIDITGLTVLPGLIDAHSHLTHYEGLLSDSPARAALISAERARRALRAGITSVRDLGSHRRLDLELRRAISEGLLDGPSMTCGGMYIAITGGHGWPRCREADGPDEVRKAVREQLHAGAHHIKMMCSGGALGGGRSAHHVQYTEDELRAAVEEATAAGTVVYAHAQPAEAIRRAVRAGVRSIEHGSFLDDECAAMMAEQGVFLTPTFSVYASMATRSDHPGVALAARELLERKRATFETALRHGVPWAVGSDCGSFTPADALIDELVYLVSDLGIDAAHVIQRATRGNATLLGHNDRGEISPGLRADLAVIDGNPLTEIRSLHRVALTVHSGAVYDHRTLKGAR